ncbi:capsule biosynthesis protein [Celeribacter sp.]|uniref:capsule biosynthesis protein n=1 Tax=Celeribacter sp. TaxID=1890673 RepID=UPI003A911F9B
MTTKPKVQKYRVRRTPRTTGAASADTSTPANMASGGEQARAANTPNPSGAPKVRTQKAQPAAASKDTGQLFDNGGHDDGFGDEVYPGSAAADAKAASTSPKRANRQKGGVASDMERAASQDAAASDDVAASEAKTGDVTPSDEMSIDEAIDAIRREGLTGRQLRMARRVAAKHGLAPTSDFDAVRLLRKKGIDPFQKSAILDLVETEEGSTGLPAERAEPGLPKTTNGPALPPPAVLERIAREEEISTIQRDIARRRRRKLLLLVTRLAVFVFLPTIIAGHYFYNIATPMYATDSSLVIKQAQSTSASGGIGSLFSGSPLGTSQEAVTVQDYLMSKDAMLRLDRDAGFKAHFSSEAIDPIQRLPENPSNEETFKVYKKRVRIGYDPTEGILKMEVVAADPQTSTDFSNKLITYAEERMDQLTQRLRDDQMQGARESLEDAEAKMLAAQEQVVELQEQMGIISPDAETSAIMSQISGFETQLQEKKLQLQQLLDNQNPNQARVDGVRGDIRRLENLVTELRAQLTQAQGPSGSLARITAELRMAEVELATRQAMVQQALQSLEMARIEVNRQVSYLATGVSPVAPEDPAYPRKFENTLLALFLFSGIYLLASLTAAVLREQVSA